MRTKLNKWIENIHPTAVLIFCGCVAIVIVILALL